MLPLLKAMSDLAFESSARERRLDNERPRPKGRGINICTLVEPFAASGGELDPER